MGFFSNFFAPSAGAKPSVKTQAVTAAQTGAVYTITPQLDPAASLSLTGASSGNLTLSGSTISATAALGGGVSQIAYVRETLGSGSAFVAEEYAVTIASPATVPAAPTLGTPTVGSGQVSIPFTDGATGGSAITSHQVYRSTAAGAETLLGNLTGASPFVDTGLINGTAYYYKLSAVNGVGEGSLSAEVSATPGIGGASATTFDYTPDYQYHINTATLTMAPSQNITASVSRSSTGNAGTFGVLNVTANDGYPLVVGDVVTIGSYVATVIRCPAGSSIASDFMTSATANGFYLTPAPASAISSTNGTVVNRLVVGVSDKQGRMPLVWPTTFNGTILAPVLMTDKKGRKFLRCLYFSTGITLTSPLGMDNCNMSWIRVGRDRGSNTPVVTVVSNQVQLGAYQQRINFQGNIPQPTASNFKKLFTGEQLQVTGASVVTTTGVVNGPVGSPAARTSVNDQSFATGPNSGQSTNITSIILLNSAQDVYELSGFVQGQMGTTAQMPTRHDAQMAKAQANFAIPAITDNFIAMGDSRSVNNTTGTGNLATAIVDSGTLPESWRVISVGNGGKGIGWMQVAMALGPSSVNNNNTNGSISPAATAFMFGGGKDHMTVFFGINDRAQSWPVTPAPANSPIAGNYASNTTAQTTEMYGNPANGMTPVYQTTYTATGSVNGNVLTLSNQAGTAVGQLEVFTGANLPPGTAPDTNYAMTSTSLHVNRYLDQAVSGTITGSLYSYIQTIATAYNAGWKITWASEISDTGSPATARQLLRDKIMGNGCPGLVADVATLLGLSTSTVAQRLNVLDMLQLTVGGRYLFEYLSGGDANGPEQRDGTHPSKYGLDVIWNGGDVPANGVSPKVLAIA